MFRGLGSSIGKVVVVEAFVEVVGMESSVRFSFVVECLVLCAWKRSQSRCPYSS